jgi:hypothetical protein
MKKFPIIFVALITAIVLASCSEKKATAASVAQEWCDLNAKAHKAEGAAKESAEAARKKFENDMTAKYDKAFMDEVGKEVEKCEDASEGR